MFNNIVRKQVRAPDGTMQIVYTNSLTGEQVGPSTTLDSGTVMDLKTLGIDPITEPDKAEPLSKQLAPRILPQQSDPNVDPRESQAKSFNRDPSNNFGYVNRPGIMDLASMHPIGRAINTGINVNNTIAANKARDMMDVPEMTFGEKARSVFSDQKGHLGDYNIGKEQYAVGLEAQDKVGRTTLTPNEARQRAGYMQTEITPASKQQTKASQKSFSKEFPEQNRGILSQITAKTKGFIDSLFDDDDEDQVDMAGKTQVSNNGGNNQGFGQGYDSVGTPTDNDASFGGPR